MRGISWEGGGGGGGRAGARMREQPVERPTVYMCVYIERARGGDGGGNRGRARLTVTDGQWLGDGEFAARDAMSRGVRGRRV